VVLGSCGSEDFENKEASGFKRVKSERSNPLETSSLSMMENIVSYLVFGQNLVTSCSC
jgi:hypothetical protein